MGYDSRVWSAIFYVSGAAFVSLGAVGAAKLGMGEVAYTWTLLILGIIAGGSGKLGASPLKKTDDGTSVNVSKIAPLVLLVLALPFVTGCANKAGLNTALNLVPLINDELKAVSDAVEIQKVPLQAQTCGMTDCYVAFTGVLEKAAGYDRVFREAAKALNTTSALQAIKDMSAVIQDAVQTQVVKLPEKVRTFLLVALEALRGGLAAAQVSLGG